ncbi:ABC transporter ATP-binding protein [Roseibium sp. HPY-6]|uniref:ABC transporter ATP-binding protein n=1 Tax=Roseibium sp. HPY-6 TaxID=3229852 RepID=UPI00338DE2E0
MKRQPAENPAIVSLKGVSKSFQNGTVALEDFTLTIRPREFLSLLGPSGCGKSTVLRIVAGLADPSGGQVTWPQEPANRLEHDLSFVFQEPTLMPWATVYENVRLPLRLKGVVERTARPRILEALEMVGLSQFAQSYPRELSGGMKMRVSIARALVTQPRVLLMDEPFAALDEITRFKLNNDLLRLWQRFDLTIVFVTHSVFESVYLSERIAVMRARPGRIAADIAIDTHLQRNEAFRTSVEYAGLCGQVSAALHKAMGEDADAFEHI